MLQEVSIDSSSSPEIERFIQDLQLIGFHGEISQNLADRVAASTDNSIWQQTPQVVLSPHSHECVVQILTVLDHSTHQNISITPRGGGTSTAGQSLTNSIVLDCKRNLHSILEYNEQTKQVNVECGAVLDEVNKALLEFEVMIGPTVATASRATIGGMIGNDSAGKGSSIYGKMSDCVVELQTVLRGGAQLKDHSEIVETIKHACDSARPHFKDVWPTLPRFATGYNLPMTWDGKTLDVNRLLCGSEGTLGVTTSAVLQCVPIPKNHELVLLCFDSFDEALRCGAHLRQFNPSAIETVDEMVIQAAIENSFWNSFSEILGTTRDDIGAILFVEFTNENTNRVTETVEFATSNYSILQVAPLVDKDSIRAAWTFRSRSVGLLSSIKGSKTPTPFVEDCAVPPESLQPFIADFKTLLSNNALRAGMFGHVDAGVIHVRPLVDMEDSIDRELIYSITKQVASLVQSYGGILWGEHGKGFRSEFGPSVFGDRIWEEMCRIKHAFDPKNQLNPSKVAPPIVGGTLSSMQKNTRGEFNASIVALPTLSNVKRCDGNSECESASFNDAMCPTYRATGNPIHSPRGRANLIRYWLQHLGHTKNTTRGSIFARIWHSGNQTDFSHEVRRALDGCLSCKACASECPMEIDIPSMRTHFYNAYFGRYLRPIRDIVWFNMERMLPLLASPVGNFIPSSFLSSMVGIVDAPKVNRRVKWSVTPCTPIEAVSQKPSIVLLQDSFTTFFRPQVIEACIQVAKYLGHRVAILHYKPSGKAYQIRGNERAFKKNARHNLNWLQPLLDSELPIVGIEPATTLLWQKEYYNLTGFKHNNSVMLPQEWLLHEDLSPVKLQGLWRLFPHCIEKSVAQSSQIAWKKIFNKLGAELDIIETSCCGMGGLFGHEREHQQQSIKIWDQHWAPHEPAIEHSLITGYSCYSQAKRITGQSIRHPLEIIASSIHPQ